MRFVIVGGGAAGFFSAIITKEKNPDAEVIILERTARLLTKIAISGGGRCNVTHSCFHPAKLISSYPRGSTELQGAFHKFQPQDTIDWFAKRGVLLKKEPDGRMFPETNSSQTIIDCLMHEVARLKIEIRKQVHIAQITKTDHQFHIQMDHETLICDKVLLATGSSPKGHQLAQDLGHSVIPPVPSLFSLHVDQFNMIDLAGVSVSQVKVTLDSSSIQTEGPILITHEGFSGPAILRMSAWGARLLHQLNYKATLHIDWLPELNQENLKQQLLHYKAEFPKRALSSHSPFSLPLKLWKKLIEKTGIDPEKKKIAHLSKTDLTELIRVLSKDTYTIHGKSTNKEEFVTAGGIPLNEVDFRTMQSKICPGLYFAGETLDIDGITGGFNFQNAWTTGFIAGSNL